MDDGDELQSKYFWKYDDNIVEWIMNDDNIVELSLIILKKNGNAVQVNRCLTNFLLTYKWKVS